MSASKEHDLIVALVARSIRQHGFDLIALESSLDWLFGKGFKLPPAIVLHRPDILGVRRTPPFLCIGEAKTCSDLRSKRTRRQLLDFSQTRVGDTEEFCQVIIGIPQDCEMTLNKLLAELGIPASRMAIIHVPRALLTRKCA
jgi:hypothetical protein